MKKQFVMVNSCFGYDMFIADSRYSATDKVEDAMRFTYGEDNPEVKAIAYSTATGLDGWEAREV